LDQSTGVSEAASTEPNSCHRAGVPIPAFVRNGVSESQVRQFAETVVGPINRILGTPPPPFLPGHFFVHVWSKIYSQKHFSCKIYS